MSIIKAAKDFLSECPYIEETAMFHVQNLESDNLNYSVEPIPNELVISEDVTGIQLCERQFLFLMQASSADKHDRDENNEFYDQFNDWLIEKNDNGEYPDIGYEVQELIMLSQPYILSRSDDNSAVYQTTMSIKYTKG